jgi:hypothetical protein
MIFLPIVGVASIPMSNGELDSSRRGLIQNLVWIGSLDLATEESSRPKRRYASENTYRTLEITRTNIDLSLDLHCWLM